MEYNAKPWRWSLKYEILKIVVRISFHLFYRKLCVRGLENIPDGGRIIFAANHQNALIDALAVLLTNKYQPVYLARADLFRNAFVARILRFLKIMPVYRLRDGIECMGENEGAFDNAASFLAAGGSIGIMPEGDHHHYKRLRPLKKGFGRIAFRAEEISDADGRIKIIPVGLNYGPVNRGELVVNYGKPIEVADYLDLYRRHPQAGINALKDELAGSLRSLMLDVKEEEYYHEDKLLVDYGRRELAVRLNDSHGNVCEGSVLDRAVCKALYEYFKKDPGKADELRAKSSRALQLMNSVGFPAESLPVNCNMPVLTARLARIAMFPVILTGLLLHLFPVTVIHLALKKVKEPEFLDSFKFVLGTVLVPLNYIIIILITLSYLPPVYSVPLAVLLPFSGILAHECHRVSRAFRDRIDLFRICKKDRDFGNKLAMLKNRIVSELEPVLQTAGGRLVS
jgi:1-acyl-sn-glycerol-3-phosphate acyltransferase